MGCIVRVTSDSYRVKFLVLRRPTANDEVDPLIPGTLIYRSIHLDHLDISLNIIVIALFTNFLVFLINELIS